MSNKSEIRRRREAVKVAIEAYLEAMQQYAGWTADHEVRPLARALHANLPETRLHVLNGTYETDRVSIARRRYWTMRGAIIPFGERRNGHEPGEEEEA